MKRAVSTICLCALFAAWAAPCGAEEATADKTLSPYFLIDSADPAIDRLPLKETRADVHISGVIADVVVTQVYRNEGTRPINARYVFPASTRAAVHGMTLQIGDQRIRAQIREKQVAQAEFDQAKAAGKSAALLKQQRPNVFGMNVANVMPGDEIHVELHYSELLVPTDGTYEFVFPTVVGPRYSSATNTAAQSDSWITSPYRRAGEAPSYRFHIQVRIAAGMPLQELFCTSHQTVTVWQDPSTAIVTLDPSEERGGNRDFILRYRLDQDQIQSGLLLYPGEDEGFFLLMVQPPRRVKPEMIPPREYVFVLDVSGSMCGFPLDTAKALMRQLVGGLRPVDRFDVILFSGGSRVLSPQSLPATPENLQAAMASIDQERGGGGTELTAALREALDLPEVAGVSRSTIVITDGYVGAEADVFNLIRNNLHRSNLFAFGVGSSVNRFLIEGMAKAGQGEPFVVTAPWEAEGTAQSFQQYVSSPLLTGVQVEGEGFDIYDVEPPSIPDLMADRPLVIFGKWRGAATGTLRVTGTSGDGAYEQDFDVADTDLDEDNRALEYLWARARVARLSDFGPQSDEVASEVTAIGLKYDLLTPYTSFVAVHEVVRNLGSVDTVDQPLPLPQGMTGIAEGYRVPEPGLTVMLGLCLFAFGVRRLAAAFRR